MLEMLDWLFKANWIFFKDQIFFQTLLKNRPFVQCARLVLTH